MAVAVRGKSGRRRGWLHVGVACVVAGLIGASGCSGKATAQPASTTSTSAASESAWQRILDQTQPDGSVGLPTALAAFALAVGPIPGAAAPSGPAQVIPSGTLAVNWV